MSDKMVLGNLIKACYSDSGLVLSVDDVSDLWLELTERQFRIAELELFIERLIEAGDGLTINPSVSDYEQREADWNKLWLEWKEREE